MLPLQNFAPWSDLLLRPQGFSSPLDFVTKVLKVKPRAGATKWEYQTMKQQNCKQCWKDTCLILSRHPGICRPRKVWCFHPDYLVWNAILEHNHGILVCRARHTWCVTLCSMSLKCTKRRDIEETCRAISNWSRGRASNVEAEQCGSCQQWSIVRG